MKHLYIVLFLVFGKALMAVPLNGTIPIGPGENYTSISLAASALVQYGINADVHFKVDPSITYGNQILFETFSNPGNHKVFFESSSNQTVVANFIASSSANNFVVKFSGAKNISFDNFKFNNAASLYQNTVSFELKNNIIPENIEFTNCEFTSTFGSLNDNLVSANCDLNNITFDHCKFTGGGYGIQLQSGNFLRNLKISHSVFDHQHFTVIDLKNTRGCLIENNVFGTPNMASTRGIKIVNADSAVVIQRNELTINYNIYIQNSNSTTPGNCITIANNAMAPNYEFALKLSGLSGIGTTRVVNNLIMAANNTAIELQNNTQKVIIKNNIIQNFSSTLPVFNTDVSFSNINYIIDRNAYFYSTFMKNGAIGFTTWKSTYGFDMHSIDDKNNTFLPAWGTSKNPICKLPKKYRIAEYIDDLTCTDLSGYKRDIFPTWVGCNAIHEVSSSNVVQGVALWGINPVTAGKAILYGDKTTSKMLTPLLETNLDNSGHFTFSNLIAQDFVLKIVPDTAVYKDKLPTYFGNNFNWKNNIPISADTCSGGVGLTIQVDTLVPQITGGGKISGYLQYEGLSNKTSDPIPGIDVVLDKIPPSKSVNHTVTDTNGYYEFNNLPYGDYSIKIDFPGLTNDSLFFVSIDGNIDDLPNLDYCVDTMVMTHVCGAFTSVKKLENKSGSNFSIYPNPFSNEINISTNNTEISLIQLSVFDCSGRIIYTETKSINGVISQDLSALEAGIYFFSIHNNGIQETNKIVKN